MTEPRLLTNGVFHDERGWFMESYNSERDAAVALSWVQDNVSFSKAGTVRGIHYQMDGQAKLVRCLSGEIMDVIVDLRRSSKTFGQYRGFNLIGGSGNMLYVPGGFGHSFIALRDSLVFYKVDRYWNKEKERCICFDDPKIGIPWFSIYSGKFIVSDKDRDAPCLADAETFE